MSIGELVDKITILEIKASRLSGADGGHARHELTLLEAELIATGTAIEPALVEELRGVNEALWEIEDAIRDHERRQAFDSGFIALARSVYVTNDRRAAIKREINARHGSEIVEVKSYRPYT